jgi:hypothetical protein
LINCSAMFCGIIINTYRLPVQLVMPIKQR